MYGFEFQNDLQNTLQNLSYRFKDQLPPEQIQKMAMAIAEENEKQRQSKQQAQSLSEVLKTVQPLSQRSAGMPQYTSQPITQLQMGTETEPFSNKSLYTNVPQNYPNQRTLQTLTGQGQPYQEPQPLQAGTPEANTQMYADIMGKTGGDRGITQDIMNLQQPKEVKTEQIDIPGEGGMHRVLTDEAGNIVKDFGVIDKNKPLSVTDLTHLVNPKTGESPKYGITAKEAEQKGYIALSTDQIKYRNNLQSVNVVLDELDSMIDKVALPKAGMNRLMSSPYIAWQVFQQTDTARIEFESLKKAVAASLWKAFGDTGRLSDQDIERALEAMPKTKADITPWGESMGLPDTREVATNKLNNVRKVVRQIAEKATGLNLYLGKQTNPLSGKPRGRYLVDGKEVKWDGEKEIP